MRNPLRPHDAHAAATSVISEWGQHAEMAFGDGRALHEHIVLAVASGRLSALVAKLLARHVPIWQPDGSWSCSSCVEIHGSGILSRAEFPCQEAQMIFSEVLGPEAEAAPAPLMSLQMLIQDGPEPYLGDAAAELELNHRLEPDTARAVAATVIDVMTAFAHRG